MSVEARAGHGSEVLVVGSSVSGLLPVPAALARGLVAQARGPSCRACGCTSVGPVAGMSGRAAGSQRGPGTAPGRALAALAPAALHRTARAEDTLLVRDFGVVGARGGLGHAGVVGVFSTFLFKFFP